MLIETVKKIATALQWYYENSASSATAEVSTPSVDLQVANALKDKILAFTRLYCQAVDEDATATMDHLRVVKTAFFKVGCSQSDVRKALEDIIKSYHQLLELLTRQSLYKGEAATNMPRFTPTNGVGNEVLVPVTTPSSSSISIPISIITTEISSPAKANSLEALKAKLKPCNSEPVDLTTASEKLSIVIPSPASSSPWLLSSHYSSGVNFVDGFSSSGPHTISSASNPSMMRPNVPITRMKNDSVTTPL